MTKMYVALGKAISIEKDGQKKPAAAVGGKVLTNLPYHEMAVYTAMQWHISDQGNLEEFYYRKVLTNSAFAETPLEDCLQSLEDKGLLASVEGQDDLAVLYQLLSFRRPKVNKVSFVDRLQDYMILRKHYSVWMSLSIFRRAPLSAAAKRLFHHIKAVPNQTVYDLVLALKDRRPLRSDMAQIDPAETAFYLQLVDEKQEYLNAVISLFFSKQIIFE